MTAPLLAPILLHLRACDSGPGGAIEWSKGRRVSRSTYAACDRGDWSLWVAAQAGVDRRLVVLAACDCAELALRWVPKGEERPRRVVNVARAWCRGEATSEQVKVDGDALWAAHWGTGAERGSFWSAWATVWAIRAIPLPTQPSAEAAARGAALAAEEAAGDADKAESAGAAELKRCAELVRKRIPWETMRDALLAVEITP